MRKKEKQMEVKLWKDIFHIPVMYAVILEMQTEECYDETAISVSRIF